MSQGKPFQPGEESTIGAHRWRPGQSGNPSGQTKAQVAARRLVSELIAAETDGGVEIVKFAIGVMRGETADADGKTTTWDSKSRRWAADFVANRLWGRAPLTVEVSGANERAPLPDMSGLSVEELRRLAVGESLAGDDPPRKVH